jgi:hypothetical protein
MDAIAARVEERMAWVSEQERKLQAAWDKIADRCSKRGKFHDRLRAKYLAPGERAPDDLPIFIVERILFRLVRTRFDAEPKMSDAFARVIDSMRTPDSASVYLGSDTYMPEAVRILQMGGRIVRITG